MGIYIVPELLLFWGRKGVLTLPLLTREYAVLLYVNKWDKNTVVSATVSLVNLD